MDTASLAHEDSTSYRIPLRSNCINCSPSLHALNMIRDAARSESWEKFDADSLPEYFTDGIKALRAHVDKLTDFSKPRRVEEDKSLWFMVESLIQARHLIDDMHSKDSHS